MASFIKKCLESTDLGPDRALLFSVASLNLLRLKTNNRKELSLLLSKQQDSDFGQCQTQLQTLRKYLVNKHFTILWYAF